MFKVATGTISTSPTRTAPHNKEKAGIMSLTKSGKTTETWLAKLDECRRNPQTRVMRAKNGRETSIANVVLSHLDSTRRLLLLSNGRLLLLDKRNRDYRGDYWCEVIRNADSQMFGNDANMFIQYESKIILIGEKFLSSLGDVILEDRILDKILAVATRQHHGALANESISTLESIAFAEGFAKFYESTALLNDIMLDINPLDRPIRDYYAEGISYAFLPYYYRSDKIKVQVRYALESYLGTVEDVGVKPLSDPIFGKSMKQVLLEGKVDQAFRGDKGDKNDY